MHLEVCGNNSNLEEDEGLRRRTSVMEVININNELEEAYGSEFDLVGL